jgi:trigger factor
MEAKVEKIENSEAYIKVIVDAEQMEKGMEKAYKQLVKKVNIPGFRKGRVPRPILEAHLGKEALYQDAMEFVIPAAYQEAVDKLNIQAIASPEFENIDIEDGLFKFDARVAVKPDIKLGNLEGLEISIPKFEVTEEHVDERLKVVQESYAQLQEKTDKPAENGDKLVIDFEGFIDEVPFPGGKGENYSLELGANVFVPGFEEQLIGVMTGEEKEVKVTFPEDYHADEVAGKEAVFKVKVNKIETKVLRALDDEFAQEVSQFDTMSELRQDLKESMQKMGEHQKKEAIKEAVIAKALERCEIPLAESVVREQIEKMKNQLEERMKMQGVSL